ncbi:MAG: O-antigen ligase family protein [Phycisphaerales bacterium]
MNAPSLAAARTPSPLTEGLTWVGLILVLAPMLFRAMTQVSILPYWDMDPLISWSPLVGIGPAGSLLVDALIILGAGLLLIGTAHRARSAWFLLAALLVSIGCVPIVYHGWSSTVFTLGQQRIGASWASAMIAGLALWHAGADRRIRIVAFAAVISFIAVLAIRGIEQIFIEHPGIIENFKRNKESILAANGWTPDSAMARGYERRLIQAEATGWFGLSNVYASFAAASTVGFVALALSAWKARSENRDRTGRDTTNTSPWPLVLACAGLVVSLGAVALADSKGGFAVTALGLGLIALAIGYARIPLPSRFLDKLAPRARCIGPVLIGAALLAVVARGFIGERIGELSVLFRWFYMQAATRIALDQWLLGTGPDGFKDAYLIFKNPLSPEEVGSPHSILFDWWACLGIAGFAWIGLWLWWVARAGAGLLAWRNPPDAAPEPELESRPLIRASSGIIILASLAAIWTETAALTPEAALIRILGLGLWLGLAGGAVVVATKHRRWLIGLVAAAIAMAVHGQIEVTGSFPQSAGLFMAIGALAASGFANGPARHEPGQSHVPPIRSASGELGTLTANVFGMLLLASVCLLGWVGVWPAFRWEAGLRRAALAVRPIGEVSQMLSSASAPTSPAYQPDAIQQSARTLGEALGRDVSATPESINRAFQELFPRAVKEAATEMGALDELDWRTLRETMRLALLLWDSPDPAMRTWAGDLFGRSLMGSIMGRKIGRSSPNEAARNAAAIAGFEEMARRTSDHPDASKEWVRIANHYNELAPSLDPYNLPLAVRVLRFNQRHGESSAVVTSARRVLELDDLQRLDRSVRGLTPAERREVEDLIKRLESAPTAPAPAKPTEPAPKPIPTIP